MEADRLVQRMAEFGVLFVKGMRLILPIVLLPQKWKLDLLEPTADIKERNEVLEIRPTKWQSR
jgi:hypothetical protein